MNRRISGTHQWRDDQLADVPDMSAGHAPMTYHGGHSSPGSPSSVQVYHSFFGCLEKSLQSYVELFQKIYNKGIKSLSPYFSVK